MIADELVEAVARALYEAWRDGLIMKESTRPWDHLYDEEKNGQRREARAAIRAVHAAMREPSDDAAWEGAGYAHGDTRRAKDVWRAMLAASPLAEAARDD